MRNIIKGLFLVLSCLVASEAFAETFSSTEINAGTTKSGISVSQNSCSYESQQICKENNKGQKFDIIKCGNTANNVDEKYVEIKATSDISTLRLRATTNNSSAKKMAFLYWGDVTPAVDNVSSAVLIEFGSYDGTCDNNYVDVNIPAGTRIIRIYRQVKNFNGTAYEKNKTFGEGNTYHMAEVEVTAGSAGPVAVTGVTLDKTSASIEAGQTLQLTATVAPSNADNKNVSWTSDNASVASVDQNGLVTANAAGSATITVKTEDGNFTAACTLTVTEPAAPVAVTGVSLNKASTSIYMGASETLTATIAPADATNKAVTWSSDKTSVATVNNGVVSGVAIGQANITVKTADGNFTATCAVTVEAAPIINVESVSLNKTSTTIKVGASETLTATVLPANAANKNVTWTSDKTNIATVNNGVVTGIAEGTAVITVTTEDGGKTATCTVTVQEGSPVPPTKLLIHVPEVYEAKDIAGGYNTPLTVVEGREYEVYYTQRTADGDYPTFATTTVSEGKSNGISASTSKTKNEGRPGDTWFEGTITEHSECKSASSEDEFVFGTKMIREHRLSYSNANTYQFHVKGFDQFSFWGMDKKLDPKNGNQVFVVKVDGEVQPMEYNAEKYTVRRFNITTKEHLIEISVTKETGSNKCAMGGFSLRVAQEPRTKYLKGNDSTQTVLQTQAIQPVYYVTKYNNIPGAQTRLVWIGKAAEGIDLTKIEGPLTDTLVLGGIANCPTGEYKYAVVAYYNGVETSRSEGKFKVATDIKAMSSLNVEVYQNEEMDEILFRYYALSADSVKLTWPTGHPAGIEGKGTKANTYIIGGTPTAAVGQYPYEITASGADTVFKGVITVRKLDYGNNPVLYLYKNNKDNGVLTYLQSQNWNVIDRKTKEEGPRPSDQYANYKWVLISEDADANNKEVLAVARGESNLPVLNMNAFSYAYELNENGLDCWGEADNGSLTKEGCYITVQRDDHPIFKSLNKKRGEKIQVLDTVTGKGLMPININKQKTLCLATSPTRNIDDYFADGNPQTVLHEIPADQNKGKKYICFPLANSSSKQLTADGKNLIKAIVSYLMNNEATVTVPTVEITKFSIKDIVGVIDQDNKTIEVSIDRSKYPDIDLTAVQPKVTLASTYTTVTPASEETVDLSMSAILPVKYVVTDYINRCIYNVSVNVYTPEGIEEVYTVGEWVNVYDIFGRKITTTNENIYTMELPRGVYIIVTETGETIKITR